MPQRIITCLLLWLLCASTARAFAQESVSEADLKAAFLYNFTRVVDWPSDAFEKEDSPFIVGVFGDEEFASTLRKLFVEKKAHGHPLTVRRLTQIGEARSCQMLFFREGEAKKMAMVYDIIKRLPILTVGEADDFLDSGGMFNLFFEEKQLRFEVNPTVAENARLTISSKVLRLAKRIRKGGK
jgi:hypothetical protein